ncbi:hypothetical protein AMECASPLE_032246 [Ameca splendens]|uniref:Uncharacterized protein n=1 Tax=Ameca splendens TaxID=208324 RepID=A0ABV0ZS59_9TELE
MEPRHASCHGLDQGSNTLCSGGRSIFILSNDIMVDGMRKCSAEELIAFCPPPPPDMQAQIFTDCGNVRLFFRVLFLRVLLGLHQTKHHFRGQSKFRIHHGFPRSSSHFQSVTALRPSSGTLFFLCRC